jgi:hypothetical protein
MNDNDLEILNSNPWFGPQMKRLDIQKTKYSQHRKKKTHRTFMYKSEIKINKIIL